MFFTWCVCVVFITLLSSSATDSTISNEIAIKKLSRPFQSVMHAKRAYREMRLLKHMRHENVSIIVIHDNMY